MSSGYVLNVAPQYPAGVCPVLSCPGTHRHRSNGLNPTERHYGISTAEPRGVDNGGVDTSLVPLPGWRAHCDVLAASHLGSRAG